MRTGLILALLAGCGGGGMDTIDAAIGYDSAEVFDAAPPADASCLLPTYSIRVIEPPEGYAGTFPRDLDDGVVVGYAADEPYSPLARPLRIPLGGDSAVLDVPESNWGFGHGGTGLVAVGEHAWHPQIWIDGVRDELDIPDGWGSGSAHDVTVGGMVVGSYADYDDALPPNPIGPRPCVWPSATADAVPLPTPASSPIGAAWEINAHDQIAGTVTLADAIVAARWDATDAQPAVTGGLDGAMLSEALGMNDRGDLVGRSSFGNGTTTAFRYDAAAEEWIPLDNLAGNYAEAFDVDDLGRAVGTAAPGDGTARAVLWIGDDIYRLDDQVSLPDDIDHLSSAVAIDAAGRIAVEAVPTTAAGDIPRHIALLTPLCP